jgi:LacI family transcriptional regulator
MAGATIRDVARRAAVSVASVSRALNGTGNVRPETQARVRAAAEALGYVPHAGARSLSLSRTHAIGVILPDLHGEFFSEVIRGLDAEASSRGYHLLLSNMHGEHDHAAQALRVMRGRVDGLVVMAPHVDLDAIAAWLPASLPVVTINTPVASGVAALRVDNRGGAAAIARHLIAIGRQHIVHVAGPAWNSDARQRLQGLREALGSSANLLVVPGDFTEASGERAVAELLQGGRPFDAIFAANDAMALGVLKALGHAGLTVPGDVAVAGFDDVPLARYLSLTTVRVHMVDIGARAAARLADALDGCFANPVEELIAPTLVVRGTTVSE